MIWCEMGSCTSYFYPLQVMPHKKILYTHQDRKKKIERRKKRERLKDRKKKEKKHRAITFLEEGLICSISILANVMQSFNLHPHSKFKMYITQKHVFVDLHNYSLLVNFNPSFVFCLA